MPDDSSNESTDTATGSDDTTGQPELGDAGQKALREERSKARTAARERDALAARLKEFEDRDKTEVQKLSESYTAAEKRAADAETALARYRVAVAKKLPAELVDRLRGSTEEELAADADSLLQLVGATASRTDFDGGARTPAGQPTDMSAVIRRAAGLG